MLFLFLLCLAVLTDWAAAQDCLCFTASDVNIRDAGKHYHSGYTGYPFLENFTGMCVGQ